ncbi:3-hydroxyacyl-CoA dehydrogenase/enoyl-CoA hydratase family protein [Geoglobus acetivorans]|uniref:Cyclohex-1-ene-1-carboxyl-CoA hydratase, BadK n=1 Tax=Geoglobus acetivorans TaxID=565033 RepID=A0A0A7GCQ9_GEOAI|nr:Cyclohex-1-ene-1-carboxyl-CoA hydratase, BadK [Geoglobus acetivorans]
MEVRKVAVLGAGAMGHAIAELCAISGYEVVIRDIKEEILERAYEKIKSGLERDRKKGRLKEEVSSVLSRIKTTTDVASAVKDADLIIEAIPEILDLKSQVFQEVEKYCRDDAIIATNTSSLSITQLSEFLNKKDRFVGLHFFNPPKIMRLVEIVYGKYTSEETIKTVEEVSKKLNRVIIHVRKDVPGFVVNRIFVTMANEAAWALENGEGTVEEIDSAVKYRMGLPMGLFELHDLLGGGCIDVSYHVLEYYRETLGESYRPAPPFERLFKAGHLGKKSGKGFYDWGEGKTNEVPLRAGKDFDILRLLAPAVNEAAWLIEKGVATPEEIDLGVLYGLNYPRGLLRMADDAGLDAILKKLEDLYSEYGEERYRPNPVIVRLVEEGKTGRKSGEGFFKYGPFMYEFVRVSIDREKRIGFIKLNRPQRANALNPTFLDEICSALDVLERDDDVRCIVITGEGRNFCAGADMSVFASGKAEDMLEFSEKGHKTFTKIETLSKPVIAAINGPAMGGGFELALACDLRVVSKKAVLALPELNLGLFPGWGGTQRLVHIVGMSRAKQAILMREPVDADRAYEWGIANYVAEPDEFMEKVTEVAEKIADGPPLAYKLVKKVMYYGNQDHLRTGLYLEAASGGNVAVSEDIAEGIQAFMYRRKPNFRGR